MTPTLPIHDCLPTLKSALASHHEAVLEAPPGAGKTSIVPLALLTEAWMKHQKIIMLEPRRVAAKLAAQRLADNLNEPVGKTVGYRIRMETKTSANTRIEVVTEGILTRMLQHDPALEGVGLIIFDEFHERSIDADLGLALCLYGRELFRDSLPLKLLVMSATLDGEAISQLLNNAPIIRSQGRQYPIQTHYSDTRPTTFFDIESALANTIEQALEAHSGSVLVFLPGQHEIRRLSNKINAFLPHHPETLLTPMYGNLTLAQQQQAIAPAPTGKRKIVLATSIAETSLTIDGVNIVIDSGQSRLPKYDPRTGLTRLTTQRVSQAASQQRAGRAGRLEAGICYRLWPEYQQSQLAPQAPPEIEQADLTSLALQLYQWGVTPGELSWLTPPPQAAFLQATELLVSLGAVDRSTNSLTPHGELIASLAVHPRFAHMMVIANTLGLESKASLIAALLPERDIDQSHQADICTRLDKLSGYTVSGQNEKALVRTIQQQAKRHLSQLSNSLQETNSRHNSRHNAPTSINSNVQQKTDTNNGLLIALAYPDRIAKQRPNQPTHYLLANGREAILSTNDSLRNHQWLAVANSGGKQGQSNDNIYLAAPLDPAEFDHRLGQQVITHNVVQWTEDGKLLAERQRCMGKLIIDSSPINTLCEEEKARAAIDWISKQGLGVLPWTPQIRQWQARVILAAEQSRNNQKAWPDLSNQHLEKTINQWLQPHLGAITHKKQLANIDLFSILQGQLLWPQPKLLDEYCPQRISVPSGSSHAIDYLQSPPVLAVKLQEMFGCQQTPRINQGNTPLTLHLLSPAKRPLQVTQDLASFWKNSYQDVKKEMKGRYPKHPWPDDPLTAVATAKTKRHLS
ncbi:ATP-dependent helicase HrpB [Gammaproteobacteria bacterium 45_16_T64]|nr:ATP-dependent helicase HrpB [Gammaproteobacteria bacterium 45_16_T64]